MEKCSSKRILPLIVAIFVVVGFLGYQILAGSNFANAADSIKELENKIQKEEDAKTKLESELTNIQKSVYTTQADIQKTETAIKQALEEINRQKKELELLSGSIEIKKDMLKNLFQEYYYTQKEPIIYAMLNEDDLSKAFSEADHILTLNQKVNDAIDDIQQSKVDVEKRAQDIEAKKEDHEKLLDLKQDQQQDLLVESAGTQQDIAQKDATIGELQAKLDKLRSNLSGFLGKAYNAKDIEDAAKFAANATGVRKDFLMGMLTIESDLGRFTGGCNFKQSRMSGSRATIFKSICKELDYDYTKKKVSCPPKGYTGTGGAMGVAQFMPDTWTGYKSSIASKTGNNPPDPWNLTDGVMGMGLKLAKGGATSKKGECNAAKLYLSGTTSSKYNWYCTKVLYWADNYESKLGG